MSSYYIDMSVAGRILLGHSPAAIAWFAQAVGDEDLLVTSRLLRTELTRLVRREGLGLDRRREIVDRLATIPVDHGTLAAAEAIVPHVKTLDAIHLASALHSGLDDLVIVSHDHNMSNVARELGFEVFDPVEE